MRRREKTRIGEIRKVEKRGVERIVEARGEERNGDRS